MPPTMRAVVTATALLIAGQGQADESLLGHVEGSETLPAGSWELDQTLNSRRDKGVGHYRALDSTTEIEYGVTSRLSVSGAVKAMSIDTRGILIDGYVPGDRDFGLKLAGAEAELKYNFLSPALDDFGLSGAWSLDYLRIDPHSGQDKKVVSLDSRLLAQKYFLQGQLVWVGNLGMEATYARREPIDNLPEGFDWPTNPEMEIELALGTGVSYRFAPSWFVGLETRYETEFETDIGQERWTVFAGPTLHYASRGWWATLNWFRQLDGGGEVASPGDDLHLVEKTRQELMLVIGFDFAAE